MLKRTICFSKPMELHLRNGQLVFNPPGEPKVNQSIPVEDIGYVILEHQQSVVSLPLLNALADNNAAVIICDNRMMPKTMLSPLDSNATQSETIRFQIEASEPLKKNLWRQTVEAKIDNQSRLLSKLGADGNALKPLMMNVKSGDTDNREGLAAKLYWKMLFGNDFCREREGASPNNLLNYGYSVLRAAVARGLMGSGLMPAFGIFHRNRYNAFPLADDIMEPFRPYVDEIVYGLFFNGETELNKEVKAALLGVLNADARYEKLLRPLDVGISFTTASLAKCMAGKQKRIQYPKLE